ncbi:M1 family metallopeptidase [candidate division KSB1 bacterium]|nr:M1 family metallopeptidase [candidate division KSB1 bacterium]
MRSYCISIIFTFVISHFSYAADLFQRNYDTQHLRLEIDFNESEQSITGIASLTVVPIDTINECKFHASNLLINSVRVNKKPAKSFEPKSDILRIRFQTDYFPTDTLQIAISYHATPTVGIYFNTPTDDDPDMHQQFYSHSEPIDARCWYPCYDAPDDKFTSEIIATVPDQYTVLSNGKLLSEEIHPETHTKTVHWYQELPHVSYLVSIVGGTYCVIEDSLQNIPVQYYVYPERLDAGHATFRKTPLMIQTFSKLFGYHYPWNKYAQIMVDDYQAQGMEHTSATTLKASAVLDKRTLLDKNSDDLVAHELAHQWFGDLVTCKDWPHLWLNEGFATYAEVLYDEMCNGREAAEYEVFQQQLYYRDMEDYRFRQPIVFFNYIDPRGMFNHISYQKASMVLHMLRYVIGDDVFFDVLKTYLHKYQFRSVETYDFTSIVDSLAGTDMSWFFDEWLYAGGHPEFTVEYSWFPDSSYIQVNVTQVQQDSANQVPVFKMPVDIEIQTTSHTWTERHWLSSRQDTLVIPSHETPLMVRFDKPNAILKSLHFIKTQDEALFQLSHDNTVFGRLSALSQLELNTIDTLATVSGIASTLANDSFWAVRLQAVGLLGQFLSPDVVPILITGLHDAHPKVRAACLRRLSDVQDPALASRYRVVALTDSSNWVISEALYALILIPDSLDFDFLKTFILDSTYDNVVQAAAFEGLREIKDERSIPFAMQFATDRSITFNRRYTALRMLEEIGIGDNRVEATLISLLHDHDQTIQNKAIQILGKFPTEKTLTALERLKDTPLSDGARRRVDYAIRKIKSAH